MTTSRLGVYLSEDVLAWLRERARQENRSVSGQVEWLLKQARQEERKRVLDVLVQEAQAMGEYDQ